MSRAIYLDHHAASRPHEQVLARLERVQREAWANPSSAHARGRAARQLLECARGEVASLFAARPDRVVFTSGGTEACNLGVLGLADGATAVVTNGAEHPAVLAAVDALASRGVPCRRLSARADTWPDPSVWAAALPEPGGLVAWQWVNHETGAIQPLEKVAEICAARGARLFVDATQGLGKLPIPAVDASAWAVAGSKLGGPAGSGALVLAPGVEPASLMHGGGQERGRRGGTPSLVNAVGLGAACEWLADRLSAMPRLGRLRDGLESDLTDLGAVVNGAEGPRVATVVDVSVPGWRGEVLVAALDVEGLAASAGAACSSGLTVGSSVLRALYPSEAWRATSSLRLSLGPSTTEQEVDDAIAVLRRVLPRGGSGA